jgi:Fic family protein
MFKVNYKISAKLLKTIKEISVLLAELENFKFSQVVMYELQEEARHLSTFSSTSIEGNPLPLTEVKRLLKTKPSIIRDTEKEIVQYNESLLQTYQLIKENKFSLNQGQIIKSHQLLMSGLLPKIKLGKLRKEAVLVNDPIKRKTVFLPPDYKDVPSLLAELIQFCETSKEVDPLILAAVFHKQFVLIHPFVDGNGRCVRILTKALLAKHGIDTFFLFSFENYYNKNVTRYFQMVGERGDFYDLNNKIDFTPWIEYFCDGILDELYRVKKIILQKNTSSVNNLDSRISSEQQKIIDFLNVNGIITDADYQKLTIRAKSTRVLDFNKLLKLKIIEKLGVGKATYYKLKK